MLPLKDSPTKHFSLHLTFRVLWSIFKPLFYFFLILVNTRKRITSRHSVQSKCAQCPLLEEWTGLTEAAWSHLSTFTSFSLPGRSVSAVQKVHSRLKKAELACLWKGDMKPRYQASGSHQLRFHQQLDGNPENFWKHLKVPVKNPFTLQFLGLKKMEKLPYE